MAEGSQHSLPTYELTEIIRSKRDTPPSHYILKIESFSQLYEAVKKSEDGKYESHTFESGGFKWKLILYPCGDAKGNGNEHISLYLAIDHASMISSRGYVDVVLKFFIQDQIRDNYLIVQDGKARRFHSLRTRHGFSQLISLKSFNDSSNGYLLNDECAFGVEVDVFTGLVKGEKVKTITDGCNNGIYTWKIEKFSTLEDEIYSPMFVIGWYQWKLTLDPNGDSKVKGKCVTLSLELCNDQDKVLVKYSLLVKDQLKRTHFKYTECGWFCDDTSTSWGFSFKCDANNRMNKDMMIVEVAITVLSVVEETSLKD